jgi:hypothetical protein
MHKIRCPLIAITALLAAVGCGAPATPTTEEVEREARALVQAWGEAIRAGDGPGLLAVYSKQGVSLVTKGRVDRLAFGDLESWYLGDAVDPQDFVWEDLRMEVLSPDAVIVTGTFILKWLENEGVRGAEMALLVREEGRLRVRIEAESLTNLEPFAWCRDEDRCVTPLSAEQRARYVGHYRLGALEFRVFEQEGQLMIEGAFEKPRNRLLYYGDHQFRLDSVPDLRLVFGGDSARIDRFTNFRDVFFGAAQRVRESR